MNNRLIYIIIFIGYIFADVGVGGGLSFMNIASS